MVAGRYPEDHQVLLDLVHDNLVPSMRWSAGSHANKHNVFGDTLRWLQELPPEQQTIPVRRTAFIQEFCGFKTPTAGVSVTPVCYSMCALPTALRGSKGSNPSEEVEW